MNRRNFLLSSLIVSCSSPKKSGDTFPEVLANPATTPAKKPFPAGPQRGVCYAHAWKSHGGGWGSEGDRRTQTKLAQLGVNWLSLTPFAFQSARNSPKIEGISSDFGESDDCIRACTKIAHEQNIKILLKPHLWVGDNSWCGVINPPNWKTWLSSYQEVVEHYAKLAQEINADGFLIGNELGSSTKADPEAFRKMIKLSRKEYSGPISYAANWDEFARVPFWDELDAIGVNSYWSLTKNKAATDEELYQGAQKIHERVSAVAEKFARPVLFTEIGFRSVVNSVIDPNTWPENDRDRSIDYTIQERAYRAIFKALWQQPHIQGFYLWKVISDGTHNEEGLGGFSFLNKPAEFVVKEYYTL